MTPDRRDDALAYPMDQIRMRYQSAYNLAPSVAILRERELKRYLFIAAKHPTVSLPIASVLDPLWHEFLLDTRAYVQFCRRLGADIIHHVPNDDASGEPNALAEMNERYLKLVEMYQEEFAEVPPADVWPRAAKTSSEIGNCESSIDLANCDASWADLDPR